MKANVLGTEYEIIISNERDDPKLEGADGYCDETVHLIVVDELKPDQFTKHDLKNHQNKVIRHELIHAFLFESGLCECSDWAMKEEMVDFFARQFPKMKKLFEELKIT